MGFSISHNNERKEAFFVMIVKLSKTKVGLKFKKFLFITNLTNTLRHYPVLLIAFKKFLDIYIWTLHIALMQRKSTRKWPSFQNKNKKQCHLSTLQRKLRLEIYWDSQIIVKKISCLFSLMLFLNDGHLQPSLLSITSYP